jgi:hypothetical protein
MLGAGPAPAEHGECGTGEKSSTIHGFLLTGFDSSCVKGPAGKSRAVDSADLMPT